MNNISSPRFLVAIVSLLSLPAALFMGKSVAQGSPRPLALLLGVVFLGILVLGIPQWLWVFAVGSIFVPGQLTALPLPFKPMELLLMLVIARFVVDEFILHKRPLTLGAAPDKFFVLGLLVVLFYHGFQDRFAMRILGSETWGGRAYITMAIAFLGYFVVQSTSLNIRVFRHLPTIVVLFGSIDFSINLISTLFPGTSYFLFNIYTNVSLNDGSVFATRWGFAANFGYLLLFWSLADCRIKDFLVKGRFVKAAAFCLGIGFCIVSGYRSSVAIAAIIVIVAAFRDFGASGILGFIPIFLVFALLVALQSMGVQLPQQIQRGLTFLPGDWDAAAVADSEGSNEFRGQVWEAWLRDEFPKHPIMGRGFGLNYEDMLATIPFTGGAGDPFAAAVSKYTRNDAFVISGNLHNGLYSTIDRFGLVGCLMFVGWTFVALRRMLSLLLTARDQAMDPPLQWLGLYIITFTIAFPMGALRTENFLPQQLFLCGLFLGLMKAKDIAAKPISTAEKPVLTHSPELAPVRGRAIGGPIGHN